jgi:hypothetical protein
MSRPKAVRLTACNRHVESDGPEKIHRMRGLGHNGGKETERLMFFKREKESVQSFSARVERLRAAGYGLETIEGGHVRATKGNLAVVLREESEGQPAIADTGLLIAGEVAVLTDLGFQKIFLSPSGRKTPALAEHLHALHDFAEDVRETLGLTSLYNEGLGTTNEKHLYDRVQNRDAGVPRRPWQR